MFTYYFLELHQLPFRVVLLPSIFYTGKKEKHFNYCLQVIQHDKQLKFETLLHDSSIPKPNGYQFLIQCLSDASTRNLIQYYVLNSQNEKVPTFSSCASLHLGLLDNIWLSLPCVPYTNEDKTVEVQIQLLKQSQNTNQMEQLLTNQLKQFQSQFHLQYSTMENKLNEKMKQMEDKLAELDLYVQKELEKRLYFDSNYTTSRVTMSNHNQTVTIAKGSNAWNCGLLANRICKRWKITIHSDSDGNGYIMIGLANKSTWKKEGNNYNSTQCYMLSCYNLTLWGANGSISGKSYASGKASTNSTVECIYENGNLSFIVNGTNHGVAYSSLANDLYPAIEFREGIFSVSITPLDV